MDLRAALDFGLAKLKIQKFKENQKEERLILVVAMSLWWHLPDQEKV